MKISKASKILIGIGVVIILLFIENLAVGKYIFVDIHNVDQEADILHADDVPYSLVKTVTLDSKDGDVSFFSIRTYFGIPLEKIKVQGNSFSRVD